MRAISTLICGLGILAIAACKPAQSEQPAPTFETRYVSARSLNCRADASPSSAVVTGLRRGQQLAIAEDRDGWSLVDGVQRCWVRSNLLTDSSPTGVSASQQSSAGSVVTSSRSTRPSGLLSSNISSASSYEIPDVTVSDGRKTRARREKPHSARTSHNRTRATRARSNYLYSGGSSCPCSGSRVCIGPRGGRYCITRGGNKRYGV